MPNLASVWIPQFTTRAARLRDSWQYWQASIRSSSARADAALRRGPCRVRRDGPNPAGLRGDRHQRLEPLRRLADDPATRSATRASRRSSRPPLGPVTDLRLAKNSSRPRAYAPSRRFRHSPNSCSPATPPAPRRSPRGLPPRPTRQPARRPACRCSPPGSARHHPAPLRGPARLHAPRRCARGRWARSLTD